MPFRLRSLRRQTYREAMHGFDVALDRIGTASIKWQGVEATGGVLAMGLADMDFPTAPPILEALQRRVAHGAFGYTETPESAIDAIVRWFGDRQGLDVRPETVVLSPGVIPAIALLLRGSLEPGAGVVVQTPAFAPIPEVVTANGFRVVENALSLEGGRYEIDTDRLEAQLASPDVAAFVLCSPHNPVGRVWTAAELRHIVEVCVANDVLVLSDEIHADLTHPWAEFVSLGSVAPPRLRLAVLTGPSKAFNVPGLRTSVTIVTDAELRRGFDEERHRINDDFGVPTLGVAALEAAYRHGARWLDALRSHLAGNVDALIDALEGSQASVIRPEAMFLVWIDCRGAGLTDDELHAGLANSGLLTEPGSGFGADGSGFVRLNIATTRARVVEAARRLRDVVG